MTVLDKLTYAGMPGRTSHPVADSPRYRFVEGDICDVDLRQRPDARPRRGRALRGRVARGPLDHRRRRTSSSPTSWAPRRCCRRPSNAGVGRFVHVSTDEVYGSIDVRARGTRTARWSRTRRTAPRRPARTCWPAPTPARSAWTCAITRCSNNYGPYQFPEKVIPLFVTNLMDGLPVPLYGEGQQRARLAARRRPLPRHQPGPGQGPRRRDLQHRRRHRADQPRAHRACCSPRWASAGRWSAGSRTARVTTCATRSTSPRSPRSSGTAPQVPFESGPGRAPSTGTARNEAWWRPLKEAKPAL